MFGPPEKKSFQRYLVQAAMQACIINPSNFLHRPRSVVCSLKLKLSSMQVFKRMVHIEMSVLEKAGCTVTRFMLYCNTDLSKGMPPISKHNGGEVLADPEIPSRELFSLNTNFDLALT